MKKTVGILLIATMAFLGSVFTVFANDTASEPVYRVDIKNICTLLWAGERPQFSVELDPALKEDISVVSEKWVDRNGKELTVSGNNIAVAGGKYKYELKLSSKKGFAFDNEFKGVFYKGIEVENYQLHYDFPAEDNNHTMIVSGDFNNIIVASPLKIDVGKLLVLVISGNYSGAVDFILSDDINVSENVSIESGKTNRISNDKYSYELVLKTKEGFHFCNKLEFLYDENKYGYTMDYNYSLSDNKHTLTIKGLAEKKQPEPESAASNLRPGIPALAADKAITNMTSDSDPEGTVFSKLRLRSTVQTNNSVKLSWKKLSNAKVYIIYGNKCGSSNKPKRLAASTGNSFSVNNINGSVLRKGEYYKFIIVALDNKANVVSVSKLISVTPKSSKTGNYKSVTVRKSVISKAKKLRKGKTLKLNARAVAKSKKLKVKKYAGLRYESTNEKIATVSRSGKITAKSRGTCYIYAYAQNGVYKKIKVKVK